MSQLTSEPRVAHRLYYDSPELAFEAIVTDIQLVAQERNAEGEAMPLWRVALDQTAFYPDSGGQPWDTGMLVAKARSGATLQVPVERVEEDEAGEVWHYVRKPLVQGAEIEGRVDSNRRLDHMQQHSGQHLLSAVAWKQAQARTVSFHLGADSSTIDLQLAETSANLADELLAGIEREVNLLIAENRHLQPRWHSRAEAEAMLERGDLLKLPDRGGPLRIMEMEGVEQNACGGTHVSATGAIGSLLIRRVEKVRAGWRLEFVCGLRAVRTARNDYEVLGSTARQLSVGSSDVPLRVAALQEENKAASKLGRSLLDELAEARGAALVSQAAGHGPVRALYPDKPVEFAKRVASHAASSGVSAVIGITEHGRASVVIALPTGDAHHAGELMREVGAVFGARGGGGRDLAQGVCESSSLDALLTALEQKLQ